MRSDRKEPVYPISIAAKLCGVHPQTLRSYERQGLISPARVNDKNRMYSEADIERVRKIQRLTQDLGVNLAGVEIILRLLDQMEDQRKQMEERFAEFVQETERRLSEILRNSDAPVPVKGSILPVPRLDWPSNPFDL
ncbi:MAG: MerR family transcriptional regulator [Armatimonadetes bacterium]|nr:MAG: MerR family transcriptional regulator [Armatimonadota bacterium]